jgi:hypothetical protein
MSEERINGLAILRMNSDAWTLYFSSIIKEFAKNKARKAFLK